MIPTYNRPQMLQRALDSVIAQTFESVEIIVVDDGSDTPTKQIVDAYDDVPVYLLEHDTSLGGAAARNTGIEAASGEFVAFLDDDDEWLPEKLARQVACIDRSGPETGFVYCDYYKQDDRLGGIVTEGGIAIHTGDIYQTVLADWCAATSLLLIRREALIDIGGFDLDLSGYQDYDLLLRLAKRYHCNAVAEPLVIRHTHREPNLMSSTSARREALEHILEKWADEITATHGQAQVEAFRASEEAGFHRSQAKQALIDGDRLKALRHFRRYAALNGGVSKGEILLYAISIVGGISGFRGTLRVHRWLTWEGKRSKKPF